MRSLVLRAATLLGVAMTAACADPKANALCEQKADCGLATDAYTCLGDLREERDAAVMMECLDEYYALIDCQSDVTFACSDDFEMKMAEACPVETCSYDGCRVAGGASWHVLPWDICAGEPFEPTGKWSMGLDRVGSSCTTPNGFREIYVSRAGDAYQLNYNGNGSITGTVELTTDGDRAILQGRLETTGSSAETLTLNVTATPLEQPMSGWSAELTGTGTRVASGCTQQVTVRGYVIFEQTWPPS